MAKFLRQFHLTNGNGETLGLNNETGLLALNPEGLGVSFNNDYDSLNGNFRNKSSSVNMNEFKVEIMYGTYKDQQTYTVFSDFISFINHPPLELHYVTDAGHFIRKIKLKEIQKTEINFAGRIKEPISFDCTTPWYCLKSAQKVSKTFKAYGGKVPTYGHPFVYGADLTGRYNILKINNESVYLTNGEEMLSPTQIEIEGACINPYWELWHNGRRIADDGYNLTLNAGEKLIVSCFQDDIRVSRFGTDGFEQSIYQYQDHKRTNFIHLPIGQSELVCHVGAADFKLTWREERLVV